MKSHSDEMKNCLNKCVIIAALVAGLIGFVAGNAFWYLASPLWIDNVVEESLPTELSTTSVALGTFKDADSVHKGSGNATLLKSSGGSHILRFTNFKATNGPDLKVYLVKATDIKTSSDVTDSQWVSLGKLKGNIGNQNYAISGGTNVADYNSVVIWCEQFGVLFASATLKPTN